MATDRYCTMIVTVAARSQANVRVAEIFGDPPGAVNITVPLGPNYDSEPTHYGAGSWQTEATGALLAALPFEQGLTGGALAVDVTTGGVPNQHFAGMLAGRSLVDLRYPPDE